MSPDPLEAKPAPQWTDPKFPAGSGAATPRGSRSLGPSPLMASLVLFVVTLLLFLPSANNDFVNYDDEVYVLRNPMVNEGLGLETITQAFTTAHSANWHPLTWLSHALDVQLYGLDATGHHVTSVLLHALVAVLLLRLLLLLFDDRWLALAAAALWALHPLRVESVTWISERKDVLSGLLGLLTLIAYVGWVYFPSRGRQYWVAICFALGLMAKPMLVSLPLVMLLLDAWPLKRLTRANLWVRVREKSPLIVLAGLAVILTLVTQSGEGAISTGEQIPVLARLENALLSLFIYLKQSFFPGTLSALYPHIANTSKDPQAALLLPALGSLLALVGLGSLAYRQRRLQPWLPMGLLWFAIMLLPVLGFVQVGYHAHADRYTYLPSIGLAIIAGGLFKLALAKAPRFALPGLGLALFLLAAKTWQQIPVWKTSVRLWEHALAFDEVNLVAHMSLAKALREEGDPEGALEHYLMAHRMDTSDATLLNHIGELNIEVEHPEGAVLAFTKAGLADPSDWTYPLNLAIIQQQLGRLPEAALALDAAQALDCQDYGLPLTRGQIAAANGQAFQAVGFFETAIVRSQTNAERLISLEQLGGLQVAMQNLGGAIKTYRRLLELSPADAIGHYNLGNALELDGQKAAAQQAFAKALASDPSFAAARTRLDRILSGL